MNIKHSPTYKFVQDELVRAQTRENEIFKFRNSILNLMFASSSGLVAAYSVLVSYARDDFGLLILFFVLPVLPLNLIYQYLRLLNNIGELTYIRLQKFCALFYFDMNNLSPTFYPLYDIYPSSKKDYYPKSQISAFTPKTLSFIHLFLFGVFIIVNNTIIVIYIYLIRNIDMVSSFIPLPSTTALFILAIPVFAINLFIYYKLFKMSKKHNNISNGLIDDTIGSLLSYNIINKKFD